MIVSVRAPDHENEKAPRGHHQARPSQTEKEMQSVQGPLQALPAGVEQGAQGRVDGHCRQLEKVFKRARKA
jgi:hypothetical protein